MKDIGVDYIKMNSGKNKNVAWDSLKSRTNWVQNVGQWKFVKLILLELLCSMYCPPLYRLSTIEIESTNFNKQHLYLYLPIISTLFVANHPRSRMWSFEQKSTFWYGHLVLPHQYSHINQVSANYWQCKFNYAVFDRVEKITKWDVFIRLCGKDISCKVAIPCDFCATWK